MPITYHPPQGSILSCDFSTGFMPPEMVKKRPVIVISPPIKTRPGLCTVVCLSTTSPEPELAYHFRFQMPEPVPKHWQSGDVWVKADMIYAVSFQRLSLASLGKDRTGRRLYYRSIVAKEVLAGIQKSILHGIGLATLTNYLG
jgi:uncharacterized protein YifN (PemK superfamily)